MTIRHPHVISILLLKRSYRWEHTAFFVRVRGHYGSPWKHKMGVHPMSNFMIQVGYQEILPQKDLLVSQQTMAWLGGQRFIQRCLLYRSDLIFPQAQQEMSLALVQFRDTLFCGYPCIPAFCTRRCNIQCTYIGFLGHVLCSQYPLRILRRKNKLYGSKRWGRN